ncbi:MAG: hypothetical protein IT384_16785 [Deltaproteobacteria bacterium]|nr:hypothetical protein [Deltaproteobacteria bacterium]
MADQPSLEDVAAAWRYLTDPETDLALGLGLHPGVLDRLVDKAMGLLDAGRSTESEALLEKLCVVDLRTVTTPFLLGALKAARSDHAGAVVAYSEAVRRAGTRPDPVFLSRVYLCRGEARALSGDAAGAKDDFENVLGLAESDPTITRQVERRVAVLAED